MRNIYVLVISLFFLGCDSDKPTLVLEDPISEKSAVAVVDNTKHIIYDNDHFDPDWVIGLDTVMELQKRGVITVDAIMITGTDAYGKAGMKYNSIVKYYGFDIPIGINHRTPMRTTPDDASKRFPVLDSRYKGRYRDITEFPTDGLLDKDRQESVELLCSVLKKAKDKSITYIVGGHLQNFSDLLKETAICNGYELIHSKMKELVISTGGVGGKPEMNLSEGRNDVTEASKATNYVFANTSIPILVTFPYKKSNRRPGDVYLRHKINSPMAFIIAVPRYGTYGDRGISDNAAIIAGVYGTNLHGNEYVIKKKVCFQPTKYGALKFGSCDKEHYLMDRMNLDIVGDYTIELLTP